jgi:hypothetical protein
MLRTIVLHAVVPNEIHVLDKQPRVGVEVVSQSLPDSPEVHGMGDYVEIVHNVELYGVHRFQKVESPLCLAALIQHSESCSIPAILI